jgi:hypothetical protein
MFGVYVAPASMAIIPVRTRAGCDDTHGGGTHCRSAHCAENGNRNTGHVDPPERATPAFYLPPATQKASRSRSASDAFLSLIYSLEYTLLERVRYCDL